MKDLSVSRTSFTWGIPVPKFNKHVIYVWLDALTNYLSALDFPDEKNLKYKNFWPANIHVIGKDILRFHAVYWPAFLMAAKIPLPKRIYGHGWILSDEKKMSKSLGNILDPLDIIKKYGIDQLRYYLIKEVSLGNDGSISLKSLKDCINNDLANNFGNLCQRVITFVEKNCNSCIPNCKNFFKEDKIIIESIINKVPELKKLIDKQELNQYMKEVINFSFEANKYFNDLKPWDLKKDNIERMNAVIYTILNQIKSISILLYPVIPRSSEKILNCLGVDKIDFNIDCLLDTNYLKKGNKIKKPGILFKKIEDDN